MQDKISKFLNYVDLVHNKKRGKRKKVFYRPSMFRSFIGFLVTGIFLFILFFVLGFQLRFIYLILLFGDLCLFLFYAINLFTKEGLSISKYVEEEE